MTAACPHLWTTVTVDHTGNIYHCCKIQPVCLGSVYTNRLHDVLNTPEICRIRVSGNPPCYAGCNLIPKSGSHLPNDAFCRYENLTDLYLDFGMACNISCIMCKQRKKYETDRRGLSADILIKNIDISPFQHIYLQGGEPLVISECRKYMAYLHSAGKKYALFTNGLLIDDAVAQTLAEDANLVSISINAATKQTHELVNCGSHWETVLENIARLNRYRTSSLILNGRMTVTVPALSEIPQFLENYRSFGFDTANFGYDADTVPEYLAKHPEFTRNLKAEIAEVLDRVPHDTADLLRLRQLGLVS